MSKDASNNFAVERMEAEQSEFVDQAYEIDDLAIEDDSLQGIKINRSDKNNTRDGDPNSRVVSPNYLRKESNGRLEQYNTCQEEGNSSPDNQLSSLIDQNQQIQSIMQDLPFPNMIIKIGK